jgi:hypothetical protein
MCSFCYCQFEITAHLLCHCNYAEAVWNLVAVRFSLPIYSDVYSGSSLADWLHQIQRDNLRDRERKMLGCSSPSGGPCGKSGTEGCLSLLSYQRRSWLPWRSMLLSGFARPPMPLELSDPPATVCFRFLYCCFSASYLAALFPLHSAGADPFAGVLWCGGLPFVTFLVPLPVLRCVVACGCVVLSRCVVSVRMWVCSIVPRVPFHPYGLW